MYFKMWLQGNFNVKWVACMDESTANYCYGAFSVFQLIVWFYNLQHYCFGSLTMF